MGSYDRLPDPEWSSADPRIRGTIERVFALADERWDRHMRELDVSEYHEIGAMIRAAKILLNVGPPLFNTGWHERVPMAMAAGAYAVSETNDLLANEPTLAGVVTPFEMPEHGTLADVVVDALKDPDRVDRCRAAHELVQHHTWGHRAEMILEMVEL